MARTVKDPEDRRNELLDIAQSYFYQKGYAATSVADIIQTAGIAKGTFYHYFTSKEDMLNHLIERISNQALFIMNEIIRDPSLNALEKLPFTSPVTSAACSSTWTPGTTVGTTGLVSS